MREIKFKSVFKEYKTGKLYVNHETWGVIPGGFASPASHSHAERIEDLQYTGRKDKNGKEIFENDIIQYVKEFKHRTWNKAGENKSLETTMPEVYTVRESVVYRDGCFFIGYSIPLSKLPDFYTQDENYHGKWEEKYHSFEVVGNIFENPELIK